MKSLGEYLRAERLARGITLEQISADTKVSMSMLKAIEEGDTGQLPASVFTKGFLRAYAEEVGLDPDAVVVEYQGRVEEVDTRHETMEKFQQRLHPEPSKKRVLTLVLVLPLLIGLSLLLWRSIQIWQKPPTARSGEVVELTQKSETASKSDSVSAPQQVRSAMPSQETLDVSNMGTEPTPTDSELDAQTPSPSPTDEEVSTTQESDVYPEDEHQQQVRAQSPTPASYSLEAKATETTWLRITIDEMQVREYLLQPGQRLTWRATKGYKLLIGNAAGLQLYLNDERIEPLGGSGKVVQLELPDPALTIRSDTNTPTQ